MADRSYQVIVPLVIAKSEDGDLYLYKGAVLPSGLDDAEVTRLVKGEFVEEIVTVPEGDPTSDWSVKQLTTYAATLGIDLGSAKSKDDILAVVVAAAK